MFGPEVMIRGGDHNIKEVGKEMRFVKTGGINLPVKIEKNAWIGARTIILKGVQIGEGAVVGAGSVVTKNILPYTINVGNSAKAIKTRFNRIDFIEHLSKIQSNYRFDEIEKMYKENGVVFCE